MPFLRIVLRSYSMLFFSQHLGLAGLLLLASFARPWAGVAGLGAAMLAVGGARLGGFRRDWTELGAYSFNALLVGLALPLYFAPSWALAGLVVGGAGLALLLSVALGGWLAGRGLPFLSLPFVLTMWVLLLGGRHLPQLLPAEANGAYWLNQAYALGGPHLAEAARWVSEVDWSPLPAAYLRALAAVLLQDSPWAGLLVALGLLWHSRITFTLSLLAFTGVWTLAMLTGGATDTYDLGANYVMGAVAVGAVFAVPSAGSYTLALVSLPLTAVLLAATEAALRGTDTGLNSLPILSLPYCLTALLLLYVLLLRERVGHWLVLTPVQRYSPEANLYAHLAAASQRPAGSAYLPLGLPFLGKWRCTQGYTDGGPTHQGPWGQALDFVVTDAEGRTFQGSGFGLSDYYCFDKPVLAPADGVVEAVVQHLADNAVGDVDTNHNWGNTVVVRHRPGLYSQLSHLRAHSVRVRPGQLVRRGEVLAACGSSGRSPEPHLHFQLQATPAVGSPTLAYPLEAFLSEFSSSQQPAWADYPAPANPLPTGWGGMLLAEAPATTAASSQLPKAALTLKTHTVPRAGEVVQPVRVLPALARALRLLPGLRLAVRQADAPAATPLRWEVFTDAYNLHYLRCETTGAVAYFESGEAQLRFTAYYGPRHTWLHALYLAAYQVPLCYLPSGSQAALPLSELQLPLLGWLHDMVAPFWQPAQPEYVATWAGPEPTSLAREHRLSSTVQLRLGQQYRQMQQAELRLENGALASLHVRRPGRPALRLTFSYESA